MPYADHGENRAMGPYSASYTRSAALFRNWPSHEPDGSLCSLRYA